MPNFFQKLSPRTQGTICLLIAVTVWSGWVLFGRYSVRASLSAYDITALRFSVAGVFLLPVLLRKGMKVGPWGYKSSIWLACLMGAPYNVIALSGMQYAPASHAAAIIYTCMLIVSTLLGILLLKEKTNALRLLGITLSVGGIGCILFSADRSEGSYEWIGSLLFLFVGTIWPLYTISVRAWKVDALHATAIVSVWSALLYLPIYFAFIPSQIGWHNWHEAAFHAIYQGIVNSILAMLCYNQGIRLLGASTSSAFIPLVPVLSTLLAIPFLQEIPGLLEWLGIGLASFGVLLAIGILDKRPVAAPK
ncbi:MAG: DMT family transporter [Rickettsiales bacterium]|nr:DMT family transporter [Rickettsiales bacterium]